MLIATPTSSPATTAPTSEPMPPITVTTNASAKTSEPISGLTLRIGAASTPPSAVNPMPSPKTRSHTFEMSTPSTRMICGSLAPARTISPNFVFSSPSQSSTRMTATTATTKSR